MSEFFFIVYLLQELTSRTKSIGCYRRFGCGFETREHALRELLAQNRENLPMCTVPDVPLP